MTKQQRKLIQGLIARLSVVIDEGVVLYLKDGAEPTPQLKEKIKFNNLNYCNVVRTLDKEVRQALGKPLEVEVERKAIADYQKSLGF